jgi:hypothetical protein
MARFLKNVEIRIIMWFAKRFIAWDVISLADSTRAPEDDDFDDAIRAHSIAAPTKNAPETLAHIQRIS